jgi:protein TonB
MDLQERDASYHRRLALIGTVVVTTLLVAVVIGHRYIRNDPAFVGWKGEIEWLPQIIVEPEVAAEAAPEPKPREPRRDAMTNVARESEFETTPPASATTARETEPDILDLEARGASMSAARPSRASSYSETFIILRQVKPRYPAREREAGIEGNVTVELLVNEQGLVAQANALELVGPMSFQDSALDAVRQFEFMPPTINGEPSSMWIRFVIKFRMND